MSELKIAIARGPQCPNCREDGFDDWWHDKTTKAGHRPVSLEARLRCHGCGRFFHVTQYGDGETHSRTGGAVSMAAPRAVPFGLNRQITTTPTIGASAPCKREIDMILIWGLCAGFSAGLWVCHAANEFLYRKGWHKWSPKTTRPDAPWLGPLDGN